MSDITISYKGADIATMDASGTKTLQTSGKYCEDDITLQYVKPSGGGTRPEANENDVILIDFDGRILYSYTAAEFANLTELPTIPTLKYSFLQQDGWNWTLSDAKTYVAKYKELVIGAQYNTTDSKDHMLIDIPYALTWTVGISIVNAGTGSGNTITVSWGDGSTDTVETGVGRNITKFYTHSYAQKGVYDIKATCTNPNFQITQYENSNPYQGYILAITFSNPNMNLVNPGVYDVIMRGGCDKTTSAMFKFQFGKALIFPRGFTPSNVNSNWCAGLPQLLYVSWPNNFSGAFFGYNYSGDRALRKLNAPEASTQIKGTCFNECRSLYRLNIPSGVTTIAASAFTNCTALRQLHFYPATPPTVDNANAFNNLSTDCVIYVPTGKLNDYKTASNYPDSNTYTYVEES